MECAHTKLDILCGDDHKWGIIDPDIEHISIYIRLPNYLQVVAIVNHIREECLISNLKMI